MDKLLRFPKKAESTPIPALYENLTTKDVLLFVTPVLGHCVGYSAVDSRLNKMKQGDIAEMSSSILLDSNWRRCATGSSFTYIQD